MMKLEQWNLWDTLLKSHEKEPKSQRRTLNLTKHLKSASEWLEHRAVTKRKRKANFDASPDASTAGSAHSPPGRVISSGFQEAHGFYDLKSLLIPGEVLHMN